MTGRLAARGLSDELNDRHYAIVDGLDGRAHYVELGEARDDVPVGSIVQIRGREAAPREVDRRVARIAEQNGGSYSVELHRQADPSASREFIDAHIRRLEAMRRLGGIVERDPDGVWRIADDYEARATRFEREQGWKVPVTIAELSRMPLSQQIAVESPTWLDRTLAEQGINVHRDSGFGREVNAALRRRLQWLVEQGLVDREAGAMPSGGALRALERRELARAARMIERKTGLRYAEAGAKIDGLYRRSVELSGGRFAMIEKSREFTLVPWRPVLERNLGKPVSGVGRGNSISWSLSRNRGPQIL